MEGIQSLYDATECAVKLNDNLTDFFKVDSGVKQGCKLSPTLLAIYINDLVNDINSLSAGVTMDEKVISSLLYADDIALIAPDEISLQKMLDEVGEWCKRWRLIVNKEKTKILHLVPVQNIDQILILNVEPLN